jgi:hypothetical protein
VENLPDTETVAPTLMASGASAPESGTRMEKLKRKIPAIKIKSTLFFISLTPPNFKSHPARVWMAFT